MKALLLILSFLLISCNGSSGSSNPDVEGASDALSNEAKTELLDLVNDHRATLGLSRLILTNSISVEIQNHANEMAAQKTAFGHSGMTLRCTNSKRAVGGGNLCGEIVAQSSKGSRAENIFSQWINSRLHRAKIEETRYNRVGIGMSLGKEKEIYSGLLFLEL